jgi:hypothetical protein
MYILLSCHFLLFLCLFIDIYLFIYLLSVSFFRVHILLSLRLIYLLAILRCQLLISEARSVNCYDDRNILERRGRKRP